MANLLNMIIVLILKLITLVINLANLLVFVFFGVTVYTVFKYCKNPRPVSKKGSLVAAATTLAALLLFGLILKIDFRVALLSAFPNVSKNIIYLGTFILSAFIGRRLFKAHEITKGLKGWAIKGEPFYILLWGVTLGLLQISYLFGVQAIIKYATPLAIVITLSTVFLNVFIYLFLRKQGKGIKNGNSIN